MLTIYYVMIGLGMVMLLLSLIDADAADLDDAGSVDSVSVFSLRTIAAGLASFGAGALLMLENGMGLPFQALVGSVIGLTIGYFTYRLTAFMYSFQGSSSVSLSSIIGKSGVIITGTCANGTAQLRVSTVNGPKEFTCRGMYPDDDPLKIQDNVKIYRKVGNLLLVEKMVQFSTK